MTDALARGRTASIERRWMDAIAALTEADAASPITPEDRQRLALASYLVGDDARAAEEWTHAHQELLEAGSSQQAARCAFWLAHALMMRGDMAQAGGWLARAQRLVDDAPEEWVEEGFLLVPVALGMIGKGTYEEARATFARAEAIGKRFADPDLIAFGRLGQGQSLIMLGRIDEGVTMHDETLVAITAGEVSPMVAGLIYCAVIEACRDIFDVRRAHEWTEALSAWCDAQQGLVPYRGQCLVHRSEILALRGEWEEATAEAERARARLSDPPGQPAVGAAMYQIGEMHRLQGRLDDAEQCYRIANQWGHDPHPGLALLRLAQGQTEAAAASIRRELDEATHHPARCKLLPAYVEIMLAARDVAAARSGVEELRQIAAGIDSAYVRAVALQAEGATLLAEGDPRGALTPLRASWQEWRALAAPREGARVRVLLAEACTALGDADTAAMELDAARWVFRELGAAPDLARVDALAPETPAATPGGLTARELEVLRLVATGMTNRLIADELVISEKTVARHLSNIFLKLGLSSRAAATAFAYEHQLV